MRASVGRGVLATGGAQAIKLGLQILSVVLLSRLLLPEDFGVVAMAGPVLAFLTMFQSLGLTQATVQRPQFGNAEMNFLFWINIAASTVVALLLVALAPLAATFYNEPRVAHVVAAMALPVLATGLGAQHSALMNRRMEFGRLAVIEVLSGVATLVTALIWALISPSYWALWGSTLAGALVGAALVWLWVPWRPGRPRTAPDSWSMIGFGAGLTGFNFANFFARNLDQILIGRFAGGVQLGLYERAYKLLLFPLSQITNPLAKVMVPTLSRMVDEPDRYRSAYIRVVRIMLLVALPGVAWAVALSDQLVPFLLGPNFAESARIFAALGFAGLVQPMNNPTGWLFVSQGRGKEFMIWGLITAGFAIAAFGIGIFWGAIGIALAYAAQEYIKTPLLWWYVGRHGPVGARDLASSGLPFVLAGFVALAGVWLTRPLLPAGLLGLILGLVLAYALAVLAAMIFPQGRALAQDLRSMITARRKPR